MDEKSSENLSTQIGIILERVNTVFKSVEKLTERLEQLWSQQNNFIREYIAQHAVVEQKATAAHVRIGDIEIRVEALEKTLKELNNTLQPLVSTNKAIGFIAAALGVSIIGLIWSLIIGQVQLVFP